MKFAQIFASAAISGFAMLLAAHVSAQPAQQSYATIVRIQGEARYSHNGNDWYPLTVGQTLGAGDVIQTAVDSQVDMVLGNKITSHIPIAPSVGSAKIGLPPDANVRGLVAYKAAAEQNVIKMQGGTVLAINKLMISDTGVGTVSDTELDLRKGGIFGNVKKLSADSQFLIDMPNGVAGVRGTTFSLSVDPSTLAAICQVLTGSMLVSQTSSGGTTTEVVNSLQALNALGQVVALSQEAISALESEATFTVTIMEGIITFANDTTTVYISPVSGVQ